MATTVAAKATTHDGPVLALKFGANVELDDHKRMDDGTFTIILPVGDPVDTTKVYRAIEELPISPRHKSLFHMAVEDVADELSMVNAIKSNLVRE